MTPPLWQKVRKRASFSSRTKEPLEVKEESEKVGLKLNIQKTKIMASGSIISWQTDGETMKIVRNFIFLGSKITEDGESSLEIKRCLLLRRKAMTKESILKSTDMTSNFHFTLTFFMVQLSHLYMSTEKPELCYVDLCQQSDVSAF